MTQVDATEFRRLCARFAPGQEFLSRQFAGPREGRFRDVGYHLSPGGNPWLEGALTSFDCLRHSSFEAGDHT